MARFGLICILFLLAACGSNSVTTADEKPAAGSYGEFDQLFAKKEPPYRLSDTSLLNNKDTTQIRFQAFIDFVPDSLKAELFGAKAKVQYTPIARFSSKNASYYLIRGSSGNKRAALMAVAEGNEFTALVPFLIPDTKPATNQMSVLEGNFSVHRNIIQRMPGDVIADGKEVFAYSTAQKRFDLIMTDPLEEQRGDLINPIDTLSKTHKLAGDYSRDKKNLVSVRDGRKPELLTIFIHIEKNNGACTGEIKGDAQIVSPTTAIYRQAGDPCILTLKFGKNGVTLEEQEGCGSRRGLECSFNGTFPKKKEPKTKTDDSKKKKN